MIEVEEIDRIVAERLESLDYCYQCGICSSVCPMSFLSDFRPRKMIAWAQADPEGVISTELLWNCADCNACVLRCPENVRLPEIIMSLRNKLVETGHIPQEAADALENIYRRNNPWGLPKADRAKWAEDLPLKEFQQGMEWLWFVGCANSYEVRTQLVAKALAKIFIHVGLDVGILGNEERCSGDSARRLGEEGLFQLLAAENGAKFNEIGAKKIVTTSPHSYNIFKNEYPNLESEVWHYTQLLAELIRAGELKFAEPEEELTVTYHDPCYLGRHNGIYDEPRFVLQNLPGIKLVEMPRNRERSFCCGGGGGRMWVETKEREHPSEVRVKEALATGAQALIVACPFCMLNFDEAIKTLNLEGEIQLLDLAELVSQRLG